MLNPFEHHIPSEEQINRIQSLREGFFELLKVVEGNTLPSRYTSLAKTALEEACQWAIKGIVFE